MNHVLDFLGKTTTLREGWNRLDVHVGAWVWGDDVLIVNCGGTLHFTTLDLDHVGRASGLECIPPRSGLVIRGLKYPERAPVTFKIGRREIPYAPSLKNYEPHLAVTRLSMLWTVAGTLQADTPGADGIEPLCGYSRRPGQILDLAAAVIPVGCDTATPFTCDHQEPALYSITYV
jgi:hypothetical protein